MQALGRSDANPMPFWEITSPAEDRKRHVHGLVTLWKELRHALQLVAARAWSRPEAVVFIGFRGPGAYRWCSAPWCCSPRNLDPLGANEARSGKAREIVDIDFTPILVGRRLLLDEVDLLVRLGPTLHDQNRSLVGREDLEHVRRAQELERLLRLRDGHGALQAPRIGQVDRA